MATISNTCEALPSASASHEQSNQAMTNDCDDRMGIEIYDNHVSVAVYDKMKCQPVLIEDEGGRTGIPICVSFVDERVLIGQSAINEMDSNPDNTFQDFTQLVGASFESAAGISYAKNSKHVLFIRDDRYLLRVPGRNCCVSPEELLAHVLRECVRLATTHHENGISSATFALPSTELASEKKIRGYAEAAALAGLCDIKFVCRAAAEVHHFVHEYAWCLQPKASPVPFIVVDFFLVHAEISLVIVNGQVTGAGAAVQARSKKMKASFGRTVDELLRCLEPFRGHESFRGLESLGLLIHDSSDFSDDNCSIINDHDRSEIESSLLKALEKRSLKLHVRVVEERGVACCGIFYAGEGNITKSGIVGKAGYTVGMAMVSKLGGLPEFIRLWGPTAALPCCGTTSLFPISSQQHGFLLRFFAVDDSADKSRNRLFEIAVKFPENHPKDSFSLEGSMASSHELHFRLLASDGHCLASIHYSVDGLVKIESEAWVAITPTIRSDWLPKAVAQSGPSLASSQDDDPTPSERAAKRARHE